MDFSGFLKFFKEIILIMFGIIGIIYFTIHIEESNIDKTRYCPHCGYDILYKIEKK